MYREEIQDCQLGPAYRPLRGLNYTQCSPKLSFGGKILDSFERLIVSGRESPRSLSLSVAGGKEFSAGFLSF